MIAIKRLTRQIAQMSRMAPRYNFCSENLPKKETIHEHAEEGAISYTIGDEITGTFQGNSGIYVLMFTCGPCGNKMARKFTKDAYHKGVVLIRCDGCENIHLIADNLGWFEDNVWNVETHSESQGKPLPKVKNEDVSKLIAQFMNKVKK